MTENRIFYFNTRDELTRVNLHDIMYIKSNGNYPLLYLCNGRTTSLLVSLNSIGQMLSDIPGSNFLRVGRSFIINANYLSHINIPKCSITLSSNEMRDCIILTTSREAIRKLKVSVLNRKMKPLPQFHTNNGKMEAYEEIETESEI